MMVTKFKVWVIYLSVAILLWYVGDIAFTWVGFSEDVLMGLLMGLSATLFVYQFEMRRRAFISLDGERCGRERVENLLSDSKLLISVLEQDCVLQTLKKHAMYAVERFTEEQVLQQESETIDGTVDEKIELLENAHSASEDAKKRFWTLCSAASRAGCWTFGTISEHAAWELPPKVKDVRDLELASS